MFFEVLFPVFSETENESSEFIYTENALYAMSLKDYPVSPGDIYLLTFTNAGNPVTLESMIDSSFNLNLSVLGSINCDLMTYPELKKEVLSLAEKSYPRCYPDFKMLDTGNFPVHISGEVKLAGEVKVSGLTRLKNIYDLNKTDFTSKRVVEIKRNNISDYFDLFKAERLGHMRENPYVRPGDRIIFKQYEKTVTISGAVKREGNYQLQNNETIEDLISIYSSGFMTDADTSNIWIYKSSNRTQETANFYLDWNDSKTKSYIPSDMDKIVIQSINSFNSFITFEGAVKDSINSIKSDSVIPYAFTSGKIEHYFKSGEKLYTAVKSVSDSILGNADLENSYILRNKERIPVNIKGILLDFNSKENTEIKPDDRIIIPFKHSFVTVTGSVAKPGVYEYSPGKTYNYYTSLAGGILTEKNHKNAVVITSSDNSIKDNNSEITAEDTIFVKANDPLYNYSRVNPVITTLLSVGTLIVAIIGL